MHGVSAVRDFVKRSEVQECSRPSPMSLNFYQ